jgi:hypothetical protein
MAEGIPFSLTPEAGEFLRNLLQKMPQGSRPVLMMTQLQTDAAKPHHWVYKGESFVLGYFNTDEGPKMECVTSELFGHRVSISTDALKHLSGRILCLRRVDARYGLLKNTQYVLVADSAPQDNLEEKIGRGFTVGALTVLGDSRAWVSSGS